MKLQIIEATGQDGLRGEGLKLKDPKMFTNELNGKIKNKDDSLASGFLEPICKPGKEQTQACVQRLGTLLSAFRIVILQILLDRINPN